MGKRVLITDDAIFMRTMLKDILTRIGCEIVGEAGNGKEAFEQYKKLKPDLVTLDITMPEHDGLEGLKLIMEYDKNAKCIMCSAMGQQTMVVQAIQTGAKDFIVKPFNAERIAESVNKALG